MPISEENEATSPAMKTADSQRLIAKYAALHDRLSELHRAVRPDMVAIDQTMAEIDAVHVDLKAQHSRPGDTERY